MYRNLKGKTAMKEMPEALWQGVGFVNKNPTKDYTLSRV